MQNWFVIRTRPRWEKKVAQLLLERGVETFCPLTQTTRRWSDRIKVIYQPLIRSCVFVKIANEQWVTVRTTPGVLNFVISNCKPVVIKAKTVQEIKQFQEKYHHVEARSTFELSELSKQGNKVREFNVHGLDLVLVGHSEPSLKVAIKDKSH